jgi:hypothetical protein
LTDVKTGWVSQGKLLSEKEKEETPMTLPTAFKRIELHLARSKEFPFGSAHHGYHIVARLDVKGHIDPELWKTHRRQCRVHRFWPGEDDLDGYLVHKPGGSEHAAIASARTPLCPANI